jgi:hypothetical protein
MFRGRMSRGRTVQGRAALARHGELWSLCQPANTLTYRPFNCHGPDAPGNSA